MEGAVEEDAEEMVVGEEEEADEGAEVGDGAGWVEEGGNV